MSMSEGGTDWKSLGILSKTMLGTPVDSLITGSDVEHGVSPTTYLKIDVLYRKSEHIKSSIFHMETEMTHVVLAQFSCGLRGELVHPSIGYGIIWDNTDTISNAS